MKREWRVSVLRRDAMTAMTARRTSFRFYQTRITTSGITAGGREENRLPGKLNVKTGPPLSS